MPLLVANVPFDPAMSTATLLARHLRVAEEEVVGSQLVRKSLDARQRVKKWVAVFRVELADEGKVLRQEISGVRAWRPRDDGRYGLDAARPPRRAFPPSVRPIVVGAGPAGLFAALYLAESGAPVTLLERGSPVEQRTGEVNGFWRGQRELDGESNLVFGEGGAGTFSDGKIYTRRRDGELGYIFRKLVDFGADPAVLQESWAHLGTDRIRGLLPPLRAALRDLGVTVRFRSHVVELIVEDGRCAGVVLAGGERVEGAPVLVAAGHSARDSAEMMLRGGAAARPRGIAIGARVEHPQALVDEGRYGAGARERDQLPPASYRLSHHPDRGAVARTFCMCPGGMVVPAMNHAGTVVVNGMSFAARRAFWANSAVIVEVPAERYGGTDPMAGFRWQDRIERRAFELADGTYAAPAQRAADFLHRAPTRELPRTSYPLGVVPVSLHDVLPPGVCRTLAAALRGFDRQIRGFAGEDGVLIAPETRTTSPIQFLRDEHLCSTTLPQLFPIGEGAGYAGGIISSALDGLRAARAIVADF